MPWITGDSGYALRPWLMTPILDAADNSPEAAYNQKQMSCRSLIEQCNGVLKMRFRCLLKHRVLHYTPPTASKIIYTCAILHNMCITGNVPLPQDDDYDEELDFGLYDNVPYNEGRNILDRNAGRVNVDLAAGRLRQQQLIQRYFV